MLKIGLFTFGGGYAMIALLENEFVVRRKWIDQAEFLNMVAVAESTPGPIAINAATYIGYKTAGVLGSVAATIAVCIPSFTIIYLISLFFNAFLELKIVAYAFRGIQVGVIFMILTAGIRMAKQLQKNLFNCLIAICTFTAMVVLSLFAVDFSSVFYILIAGVIGLSAYLVRRLQTKAAAKKQPPANGVRKSKIPDNAAKSGETPASEAPERETPERETSKNGATENGADEKEAPENGADEGRKRL